MALAVLSSAALAGRALPRRSPAPSPRPCRAGRAQRGRRPRCASENGNGAPPTPPPQESWWQRLSRDLDLGPAGWEDGSASGVMGAMDFGEATTQEEGEALEAAKAYVGEGVPMTAEQSAALKKRIGGSYRGFFKEWVRRLLAWTSRVRS